MAHIRRRVAALVTTAAVGAGVLVGGAGTAVAADPPVRFAGGAHKDGGSAVIFVNGRQAGAVYFKSNGDSLKAVDTTSDGYGIAAYLGTNPVREATTRGHTAPYTATKNGNLPEGKKYSFWGCVYKGGWQRCSPIWYVKS